MIVPRHDILLDACVAINLIATDCLNDIAETLDYRFTLISQAAREVCYLQEVDGAEPVAIDIDAHVGRGVLTVLELTQEEYPLYVNLAATVDDGEAATIAAAVCRHIPVATDDRKARRVCAQQGLPEPLRTLQLLLGYAGMVRLEPDQAGNLLANLRDRASFRPRRSDPAYDWWVEHVPEAPRL